MEEDCELYSYRVSYHCGDLLDILINIPASIGGEQLAEFVQKRLQSEVTDQSEHKYKSMLCNREVIALCRYTLYLC